MCVFLRYLRQQMKKIIGAVVFYTLAVFLFLPCLVVGGIVDSVFDWWELVKDFNEEAE